ncbi:SDR family oxidoreductase [Bacillus sp. 2205SS5-2]|uniref:SDR family oxidoreductase n=1 Tax=Bacillus sp. 2205SS5-2 TaxID=3109031 RepID=UPI0030065226
MKKIVVAGGTGYLGRFVVKELKESGFYVRAMVRNQEKIKTEGPYLEPAIYPYIDEFVSCDVTKPETMQGICDGMDYVFSSLGITRQKDKVSFEQVDFQGNLNILREAEKSGVKKFLYVHVFKEDNWKSGLTDAKEKFVTSLIASELDHIVIRPTGYFSDLTAILQMARKGRDNLPGNGLN